ncbi:MAG: RHS repeat-associated core domain-containing protein [Microthrixaceae bacterium]
MGEAGDNTRLLVYNRFVDDANYDLIEFRKGAVKATVRRAGFIWSSTLGEVSVPSGVFKVRYSTSQNWVSVKVWAEGQSEPLSWNASFNDFLPFFWGTPKIVAVGGTDAAGSVRVDDFSVATTGDGKVAGYEWDDDGRLTKEVLPAGKERVWDYTDGRLSGYSQTGGGIDRATTLGYDSTGRIASETTGSQSTLYGYDVGGQLGSVDAPGTTGDSTYTYSDTGLRETATTGGVATGYVYYPAGQLASTTPAGGTPTVYSYDPAGRRTSETTGANAKSFGYDPAGRLTTTSKNGSLTSTRTLDLAGQPETVTGSGGVTYLDWTPGGELVSVTRPGEGIATLTRPGGGTAWSSATQGTGSRALSADIYGSTLDTGLAAGASYDAYGKPVTPTGATVAVGYRGEVSIDGLAYLRARNYDPGTGSFTTVDPVAPIPGAAGANPYTYVNNSPLNYTDPTGMFSVTGALGTAGKFVSGYSTAKLAYDLIQDPAGTWKKVQHAASKTVGWVVDHKGIIAATVVGIAVGAACTGLSLGLGAFGCAVLAGGVAGGMGGAFTNCGGNNTASQCATGTLLGGVVGAATGALFYGGGKILGAVAKSGYSRFATTRAGQAASRFFSKEATATAVDAAEGTVAKTLTPRGIPDPFAGVREASQYLQDAGVPRSIRKEILGSFEPGTVRVQNAGADTFGVRFYGGGSDSVGRYLSPTLPASRRTLALPPGNPMSNIAQFQVRPGAKYFTGRVAPNFGNPGGGIQHFIPDLEDLIRL